MNKKSIKKGLFAFDSSCQELFCKSSLTLPLYERLILGIETRLFRFDDYRVSPSYRKDVAKFREQHFTEEERNNPKKGKALEREVLRAFISGRFSPNEFILYRLRGKTYWERRQFLSDLERTAMLKKVGNHDAYEEMTDKGRFYEVAKNYFHREACVVGRGDDKEAFLDFASRHDRFIVKPIDGSTGNDATIVDLESLDVEYVYERLVDRGTWIAEELIQQHEAMAAWNATSVNTLRVPTFPTPDGCRILQPFFRTGRAGATVDNAGQGGVFAVFDPESGIVVTDGVDEYGGRYECHPDSGLRFKGWQIPHYDEMKALAAKLIHELPSKPRYVGFDFALTPDGWVLVEGNYNGQFVGQMAELKGVRDTFIRYYQQK